METTIIGFINWGYTGLILLILYGDGVFLLYSKAWYRRLQQDNNPAKFNDASAGGTPQ